MIKALFILMGLIASNNKQIDTFKQKIQVVIKEEIVLETLFGTITGYGIDCIGCSNYTAAGYFIKESIYYNDKKYGKVRVFAADKKYPFGTIVKLNNYLNKEVLGIVLDRGSKIGTDKRSQIDVLFESEKTSYEIGIRNNIKIEVLRYGY